MEKDLNKKMLNATKWSSVTEIGSKLISPITNAILARLLVPEAFGVVATLTMVISFAEIFTDAGFQKYLVQHKFEDEEDLDISTNVAFWTNLIISLAIWGVIAVFATPIANLVGSPGYEKAIIIISAEIPLLAFSSIQMARYRRDFDFKNLFVARMAVALVPLVITVPLAFLFHTYWALVAGTLAKDVLNALVLMVRSRWKPSLRFSFRKLKAMISFSFWTIAENVTVWLSTNAGTFIVGSVLGAYYLGLYKTTINTVGGYFNIFQGAIMPVLFSALARCQDNDEEFRNIFFKFQRMVALLVFPLGFGVFAYRELATWILLGSQWAEVSDFLGMRSLTRALMLVISYFNSEVFRSKGKPRLSAMAQMMYLVALIPSLFWATQRGFTHLTYVNCAVSLVLLTITSAIVQTEIGINFISVVKNIWPSLFSSVVMAFAGTVFLSISKHVLWQVLTIILCAIIYAMLMMLIPSGRRQLKEVPVLTKIVSMLERMLKFPK